MTLAVLASGLASLAVRRASDGKRPEAPLGGNAACAVPGEPIERGARSPRVRSSFTSRWPKRCSTVPFLRATLANFFFFLNFASYFLLPLFLHSLGGTEATIGAVMGLLGPRLAGGAAAGRHDDRSRRSPAVPARRCRAHDARRRSDSSSCTPSARRCSRCAVLQGVAFAAAFTATTTFAAEFAPRGAAGAGARPVRTVDLLAARHRARARRGVGAPRRVSGAVRGGDGAARWWCWSSRCRCPNRTTSRHPADRGSAACSRSTG